MASHAAHNPRTPEMSRAVLLLRLSIDSTSESEAALIAQPIFDDMKKEDMIPECSGIVGGAYLIEAAMDDDDVLTLTY